MRWRAYLLYIYIYIYIIPVSASTSFIRSRPICLRTHRTAFTPSKTGTVGQQCLPYLWVVRWRVQLDEIINQDVEQFGHRTHLNPCEWVDGKFEKDVARLRGQLPVTCLRVGRCKGLDVASACPRGRACGHKSLPLGRTAQALVIANVPAARHSAAQAVSAYRSAWLLGRGWHFWRVVTRMLGSIH